ncbi:MAG TPA: A/G-specific adenine glycosylase [Polyangiaceae bacterium]|nr:A/G-specific adenine glycosylase [Polyangiaceae bacterium]
MPWRESASPYSTWVSEIMLQQTQVAAVVPYFERWMARFPTITELASAHVDEVLSLWQGLGYYSRARNLHRAAQLVVESSDGKLPSSLTALRALPGIGAYTAGAIASIAFDLPEPAVDGNVERVIARLAALRGDPKTGSAAKQIRELASDWVQLGSPRRFNQALMELGALVCTPDKPNCSACPVLAFCAGHRQGIAAQLPESRTRPKPETRHVSIIFSDRQDAVLIVRQPDSARHWSALFTLPFTEHKAAESPLSAARRLLGTLDPMAQLIHSRPIAEIVYPITRFRFEARVYRATPVRATNMKRIGASYVSVERLAALALPAPHRRLVKRLLTSPRPM